MPVPVAFTSKSRSDESDEATMLVMFHCWTCKERLAVKYRKADGFMSVPQLNAVVCPDCNATSYTMIHGTVVGCRRYLPTD